jgi:hypothetical protein
MWPHHIQRHRHHLDSTTGSATAAAARHGHTLLYMYREPTRESVEAHLIWYQNNIA